MVGDVRSRNDERKGRKTDLENDMMRSGWIPQGFGGDSDDEEQSSKALEFSEARQALMMSFKWRS